jgi:hypothetical protein
VKSAIVAELLSVRQHFFRFVCGCPEGLLGSENFGKLFFLTLLLRIHISLARADGMLQRAIYALER